jgi:putative acetyltransferase
MNAVAHGSGMTIREAVPADRDELVEIWLRSVRATHAFLTENDIHALLPAVRQELGAGDLELWVLAGESGTSIGFMGLSDANVEALFLDPDHRRRGGGRLLLEHARRLKGALAVDVNEQNPEAVRFYEALGFTTVSRSPDDGAGRPFPLLHMQQRPAPDPRLR